MKEERYLLTGAGAIGAFALWTLLIQCVDVQAVGQMRTNHSHRHHLAFGHILSTRDNLNKFRLADIHLANLQMVGIRMGFELFNTARYHFIESFVRTDNIFHGNTGHRVFVGQFFSRFVELYIIV